MLIWIEVLLVIILLVLIGATVIAYCVLQMLHAIESRLDTAHRILLELRGIDGRLGVMVAAMKTYVEEKETAFGILRSSTGREMLRARLAERQAKHEQAREGPS